MSYFDWLIGEATSKAAEQVEGRIENEFRSPFSVPVMDAGFEFNKLVISETKKFVRDGLGIADELHRVVIFSSLNVQLDRAIDKSHSVTDSNLYLIRGKNGLLTALLFMGCSIEEQSNEKSMT